MDNKLSKEFVNVFLRETETTGQRVFYCFNCRSQILRYTGQVVMVANGSHPDEREIMTAPLTIPCRGNNPEYGNCPIIYVFEGFTSPAVKSWIRTEVKIG